VRNPRSPAAEAGPHSVLALFRAAFQAIDADSLSRQVEGAQAEQPLLALTLKLTSIYARFLERAYMTPSRRRSRERPLPDGDGGSIITWPPEVESQDIFEQLERWSEAVIEIGAKLERDSRVQVRTCRTIVQDYRAAAQCVENYRTHPPQTDEQWSEYRECLDNLSLYASEVRSHNCKL